MYHLAENNYGGLAGQPPLAKSRVSFNATKGKRNHLWSNKAAIGGFVRDSDGRGVPAGGD